MNSQKDFHMGYFMLIILICQRIKNPFANPSFPSGQISFCLWEIDIGEKVPGRDQYNQQPRGSPG